MLVSNSEILLFVISIFLSSFFSGAEAMLLSIDIDRARQLMKNGGKKEKIYKFLITNSNDLLNTILIGNNIVNILAASLSATIASRYFESNAIGISTGFTTILILIFGEIIPKSFARSQAEKFSIIVLNILKIIYYILFPLAHGLGWITKKVLGDKAKLVSRRVTKSEIEYFIDRADKENTMDAKQIDLITSVLEFPTIKVKDIMIPRLSVKYIDLQSSFSEILQFIAKDSHSRYPVCEGGLDHIIGFLHVKDLIGCSQSDDFNLKKLLKDPFFIYGHMKIHSVFEYMKRKKVHLGLVKDENGLVVGIVTLEDIIEEIMGEIEDEHDHEEASSNVRETLTNISEGIFVDAQILLRDLYSEYNIKIEMNDNYSTLTGFILNIIGNTFPEQGQIVFSDGYSFELSNVKDNSINIVKITHIQGDHLFSKQKQADSFYKYNIENKNDSSRSSEEEPNSNN